jgi:hypothetical protein
LVLIWAELNCKTCILLQYYPSWTIRLGYPQQAKRAE